MQNLHNKKLFVFVVVVVSAADKPYIPIKNSFVISIIKYFFLNIRLHLTYSKVDIINSKTNVFFNLLS